MQLSDSTPPDKAFDDLVLFFKALSDASRLRIVALLMERPHTGEELAQALGLTPPTISHHLRRLVDAGLVTVVPDQYYRVYSLSRERLQEMAGRLLQQRLPSGAAAEPPGSFEEKVLRDFLPGSRLSSIPRQRKKREVILRRLVINFEPGRDYSEAEVNEVLGRYHEDTATLRRELVSYGMLTRERGVYRRPRG